MTAECENEPKERRVSGNAVESMAKGGISVNVDKAKKALQKNEVRIAELDTIIKRLYEDNILGKISDERFAKLSAEYEHEQTRLVNESVELRETISASENKTVDIDRFLKTEYFAAVARCKPRRIAQPLRLN